jgi:hypothetical protein
MAAILDAQKNPEMYVFPQRPRSETRRLPLILPVTPPIAPRAPTQLYTCPEVVTRPRHFLMRFLNLQYLAEDDRRSHNLLGNIYALRARRAAEELPPVRLPFHQFWLPVNAGIPVHELLPVCPSPFPDMGLEPCQKKLPAFPCNLFMRADVAGLPV